MRVHGPHFVSRARPEEPADSGSYMPAAVAADTDALFIQALRDVVSHGERVVGGQSRSVGSLRATVEVLNYSATLTDPRARLLANPWRRVNLVTAVARFVWMMTGSERLADIGFYEPQVSRFSDDGRTVPGSNVGRRILQPRPGINQLKSVLSTLRNDPSTRRAAISLYHPEDAGRESADIPCAFGLFFNIRNGQLETTTVMRSNNLWALFPYNVFEFTLLGELVANELQVEIGGYHHFVVSLHLYDSDRQRVEATLTGGKPCRASMMLPMPREALKTLDDLIMLEREIRAASITTANTRELAESAQALDPYWRDFALILLCHRRAFATIPRVVLETAEAVREPLRSTLLNGLASAAEARFGSAPGNGGAVSSR